MENVERCVIGKGSFPHSVPVACGSVIHHGKRLSESAKFAMTEQKNVSHSVCLHNGKPHSSSETAFFKKHFKQEEYEICSKLCLNGCR